MQFVTAQQQSNPVSWGFCKFSSFHICIIQTQDEQNANVWYIHVLSHHKNKLGVWKSGVEVKLFIPVWYEYFFFTSKLKPHSELISITVKILGCSLVAWTNDRLQKQQILTTNNTHTERKYCTWKEQYLVFTVNLVTPTVNQNALYFWWKCLRGCHRIDNLI